MKIGFYPGSFSPWHDGHQDILNKALKLFDKIVILQLTNPSKPSPAGLQAFQDARVEIVRREQTFLWIAVGDYLLGLNDIKANQFAIIRGLRNENDLEYERVQQYWNEDLGMKIPFVYFIADRALVHYSSSALRTIQQLQELEDARHSRDSE